MTPNGGGGEDDGQREMVMSCVNDELLHSFLRGATALGTARLTDIFAAVSLL